MRRTCSAAPTQWRTARCWTWWSRWGREGMLEYQLAICCLCGNLPPAVYVGGQRCTGRTASALPGRVVLGMGELQTVIGWAAQEAGEQQHEQPLPGFFPPPCSCCTSHASTRCAPRSSWGAHALFCVCAALNDIVLLLLFAACCCPQLVGFEL